MREVEFKVVMVPLVALKAVAKKLVEVALAAKRVVELRVVTVPLVAMRDVAKRAVEVTFVPVPFVKVKFFPSASILIPGSGVPIALVTKP